MHIDIVSFLPCSFCFQAHDALSPSVEVPRLLELSLVPNESEEVISNALLKKKSLRLPYGILLTILSRLRFCSSSCLRSLSLSSYINVLL